MLNLIFSILKFTNITKLVIKPAVQTSETDKMKGSYKLTKDRDSCDSSSVQYASKCPQTRKRIQLEKSETNRSHESLKKLTLSISARRNEIVFKLVIVLLQ